MKQLLGTGAFPAALLLLLALSATGATVVAAPQQPRASYKAFQEYAAAPVDAAEQEEEENQGAEQDGNQLPWYQMLPKISQQQLEQMADKAAQAPYVAGLKDRWDAMKGQVRDYHSPQLQKAFENVKRLTALSVGNASQSNVAKFMKEFFQDPEVRSQMAHVLLGALGMVTAGMVLKDCTNIVEATATAVYLLVLTDLFKNWSLTVDKLAKRVGENEGFQQSMAGVREKLAGLLRPKVNGLSAEDGDEEGQLNKMAMDARMNGEAAEQPRERA